MLEQLKARLNKEMLFFDGGMGTQLQKAGMRPGVIPETLNVDEPEMLIKVHMDYLQAGADFITLNTFGCNRLKMEKAAYSVEEMITAEIRNAREAQRRCGREKDSYIVLDIGPIGQLLAPLGTLSFDEAYDIFKQIIVAAGTDVDVILFETMTDIYEVKAGILAAKENSDRLVFTSMTFEKSGRSLTGTDALTYVNIAEGLGADAVGVNCSLGPDELAPVIETILENAHVPVLVQPNAGLPSYVNGETVFLLGAEEFSDAMVGFAAKGIAMAGGCCGTTPAFIEQIKAKLPEKVCPRNNPYRTIVSSSTQSVVMEGQVVVCGERLNPTGKKKLQAALREGNFQMLVTEALAQEEAGADVLDVNVGLPDLNEAETMKVVIPMLQEVTSLPLQIDSSSAEAIEVACRYYNGRPLINSVNGKDAVLEAVLPIVKKYGGIVIGLTLEEGIPLLCEERVALAEKIIKKAGDYGIPKEHVVIDCLTLTASAQQKEVAETIKAVAEMKKRGQHTVLGVSNVSFGLPNRPLLNRTFLALAMQAGLDLPIINPLDAQLMGTIDAYNVLFYYDKDSAKYIERHANDVTKTVASADAKASTGTAPTPSTGAEVTLTYAILKGMKEQVKELAAKELQEKDGMTLINEVIIPALNEVGKNYESGKIFLPQLIQSAETTKLAFEVVQETFATSDEKKGPVLVCTVEGDVHDIGKNIVKVVLESYGYQVIDLGKDVKVSAVVEACKQYSPEAIGLSALMTTTVVNMKRTIEALHEQSLNMPIWVGGAVLTQEIADEIGADHFCQDAMSSVHLLEKMGL